MLTCPIEQPTVCILQSFQEAKQQAAVTVERGEFESGLRWTAAMASVRIRILETLCAKWQQRGIGMNTFNTRPVPLAGAVVALVVVVPSVARATALQDIGAVESWPANWGIKFIRGDANLDKVVDISDAITLLLLLFADAGPE